MAGIPKRVVERFVRAVPKFQKVLQIAKDRDVNESDTVSILTDILSEVFGYDKYLEVTSELAIRGTYCDLALKVDDKVQFLVEAKAIGIDLKDAHTRQAKDYGANHGIQWVVLTNALLWRVYRIRFEQPISYDLVCSFELTTMNPRDERDLCSLFLLSREALNKGTREEFYEKRQSVNRYIIGSLILSEPMLSLLRRELKKLSQGTKVDLDEVDQLVRGEVLKREVVEGEEAEAAMVKVKKFYRKACAGKQQKSSQTAVSPAEESVTERLLEEAGEA